MGQVVDTSSFHSGMKVIWQEGIWEIIDCQHHKMGRGGAIVRTKLKNIESGSIVENSFRSGDKLERVIFDDKAAQFLYQDGENYVFMDMENYDQIYIHKDSLGSSASFLTDNLEVELEMHEGRISGDRTAQERGTEGRGDFPGLQGRHRIGKRQTRHLGDRIVC